MWCAVALGISEARDLYRQGLMTKDGGREALDYYFHRIPLARNTEPAPARKLLAANAASSRTHKEKRRTT